MYSRKTPHAPQVGLGGVHMEESSLAAPPGPYTKRGGTRVRVAQVPRPYAMCRQILGRPKP
jgi:hypothetical protein